MRRRGDSARDKYKRDGGRDRGFSLPSMGQSVSTRCQSQVGERIRVCWLHRAFRGLEDQAVSE